MSTSSPPATSRTDWFECYFSTIDRICQRWAVSVAGGSYAPWASTAVSKPPPLPDDLAVDVDQAILHAPEQMRQMITDWYRTPKPAEVIGERLSISRTAVYPKQQQCLAYLLGVFTVNGVLERYRARTNR